MTTTEQSEQSRAALKALALAAKEELADASTAEALEWTARTFGDEWIVASNMQDAVLIDLAVKAKPDIDVLFLETGYHFAGDDRHA